MVGVSKEVQNLRQIRKKHLEADKERQRHQQNRKRIERGEERSRSPLGGGYSGRGYGYIARGKRGGGHVARRGEGRAGGRTGGRGDMRSGQSGREEEARFGDSSQDFSQDDGSASAASIEIEDDILQQEDERKREEEEGVLARIPINLLLKITPIALKEGLSVRQVVMMVSAFIMICKLPLDRFILSLLQHTDAGGGRLEGSAVMHWMAVSGRSSKRSTNLSCTATVRPSSKISRE